jgi:hypothetical protein
LPGFGAFWFIVVWNFLIDPSKTFCNLSATGPCPEGGWFSVRPEFEAVEPGHPDDIEPEPKDDWDRGGKDGSENFLKGSRVAKLRIGISSSSRDTGACAEIGLGVFRASKEGIKASWLLPEYQGMVRGVIISFLSVVYRSELGLFEVGLRLEMPLETEIAGAVVILIFSELDGDAYGCWRRGPRGGEAGFIPASLLAIRLFSGTAFSFLTFVSSNGV